MTRTARKKQFKGEKKEGFASSELPEAENAGTMRVEPVRSPKGGGPVIPKKKGNGFEMRETKGA